MPETRNLHSHCCENPKSHMIHISTAFQINMLNSAKCHNNYEYHIYMNTIFTQMQDNSNLRWAPHIKHDYQGKMYLSKSITTPSKIKHLVSKNILVLILHI